jgi:DNA-binding transcriptional regulator WhiA
VTDLFINSPGGARKNQDIKIPQWILRNKEYLKRYLRGLYEAEGSFCVHEPTYTYKFIFSNKNESLLGNVYRVLKILGFHPHESKYKIQISKRDEVYKIKDLIKFRKY